MLREIAFLKRKKAKKGGAPRIIQVNEVVTKGLPWTIEEEALLKALVEAKTSLDVIAGRLGRQRGAVLLKCRRLGLSLGEVADAAVPLPAELPSVEETLKKLAGALEAACAPGLNRVEVQRLQVVATLAKTYKEILSDYINYREIEAKLNDMEAKYAALLRQQAAGDASQPDSATVAKNTA
jgi:hypothetical protein